MLSGVTTFSSYSTTSLCDDLGAELGHYLAVDLDQALLDEFVGFAARADAGIAHIFVETDLFVGIGYGHFVFHAFGARSEALATAGESVVVLAVAVVERALSGATLVVVGTLTTLIVVGALLSGTTLVVVGTLAALVVIGALLALLISALAALVVVGTLLALLISALTALIVVGTLLTGLIAAFAGLAVIIVIVVATGLIGSVVIVVIVVSTLTLLISALLTLLIGTLGTI